MFEPALARWGGLFFLPLLGQLDKGYFVWLDALIVAAEIVLVVTTVRCAGGPGGLQVPPA